MEASPVTDQPHEMSQTNGAENRRIMSLLSPPLIMVRGAKLKLDNGERDVMEGVKGEQKQARGFL